VPCSGAVQLGRSWTEERWTFAGSNMPWHINFVLGAQLASSLQAVPPKEVTWLKFTVLEWNVISYMVPFSRKWITVLLIFF